MTDNNIKETENSTINYLEKLYKGRQAIDKGTEILNKIDSYRFRRQNPTFKEVNLEINWRKVIPITLLAAFVGMWPIPLIVAFFKTRSKMQKSEPSEEEIQLQKVFEDYTRSNWEEISLYPERYRYPLACDYIWEVIQSGRVRNFNEALNMCDEYIHRCKVERGQQAILQSNERIIEQLSHMPYYL